MQELCENFMHKNFAKGQDTLTEQSICKSKIFCIKANNYGISSSEPPCDMRYDYCDGNIMVTFYN